MKNKPKNRVKDILVSFLFISLFFIVFEIVLRIIGYGNLVLYDPHETLLWVLKPEQDCYTKVGHHPIHISGNGHRGDDFTIEKKPGTLRILCLGNSCTFGWGVRYEDTYVDQLEKLIREKYPELSIEIINGGVNAYSLLQQVLFIQERGIHYQPDIITISFSFTEGWQSFSPNSPPEVKEKILDGVRTKNILRQIALYHLFGELQFKKYYYEYRESLFADSAWESMARKKKGEEYETQLLKLIRLLNENGTKLMFIIIPSEEQVRRENPRPQVAPQRLMVNCGASNGIPVVDVKSTFRASHDKVLYLDNDNVHPNPVGHLFIAQQILETLEENNYVPRIEDSLLSYGQ
jgi:lysophospholipase L1-like esterase